MFVPHSGYAFENFVERSTTVKSKAMLFDLFVEVMGFYGFDRVNFSIIQDTTLPKSELGFGLISTYPEDWKTLYDERRYAEIDPVVKSANALNHPFTWRELAQSRTLTRKQRRFFAQAEAAGLCNGIGLPFNGAASQIAGVALATSTRSADHSKNRDLLSAFANQFYVVYKRIVRPEPHIRPALSPLTRRETQILQLIATGKTDESIGRVLSISENTVSYFVRNVFLKLNATTRVQAIVTAIASGLIDL
jgi:LuxR family quorum-sensing system transcriptional regulator CciR